MDNRLDLRDVSVNFTEIPGSPGARNKLLGQLLYNISFVSMRASMKILYGQKNVCQVY